MITNQKKVEMLEKLDLLNKEDKNQSKDLLDALNELEQLEFMAADRKVENALAELHYTLGKLKNAIITEKVNINLYHTKMDSFQHLKIEERASEQITQIKKEILEAIRL